jgi:hypothetical protein
MAIGFGQRPESCLSLPHQFGGHIMGKHYILNAKR